LHEEDKRRALEHHMEFLEAALGEAAVREGRLRNAVRRRDVIGQARGILIEREHCTSQEAFRLLRAMAQHLEVRVRDVAAALVKDAEVRAVRERLMP
jgi:hypothetical protein